MSDPFDALALALIDYIRHGHTGLAERVAALLRGQRAAGHAEGYADRRREEDAEAAAVMQRHRERLEAVAGPLGGPDPEPPPVHLSEDYFRALASAEAGDGATDSQNLAFKAGYIRGRNDAAGVVDDYEAGARQHLSRYPSHDGLARVATAVRLARTIRALVTPDDSEPT